jgi:hypothetical protein
LPEISFFGKIVFLTFRFVGFHFRKTFRDNAFRFSWLVGVIIDDESHEKQTQQNGHQQFGVFSEMVKHRVQNYTLFLTLPNKNRCKGQEKPCGGWIVRTLYYASSIAPTGQPSLASAAEANADSGTSPSMATATSPWMLNTSGQVDSQRPQPMQPSFTLYFMMFLSVIGLCVG